MTKTIVSCSAIAQAFALLASPASAQPTPDDPYVVAGTQFSNCLKHVVQMGMTTKMDPAAFKEGFAKSCQSEEAQFRAAGVKAFVAQGKTEAQARAEVDGNIANGRRIFAADQENYVRTGVVPR